MTKIPFQTLTEELKSAQVEIASIKSIISDVENMRGPAGEEGPQGVAGPQGA